MTSIDNILTFIEKKNLSIRQFETEAGLANGTLNENRKRGADLSSKNIEKISKRYGAELLDAGFYVLDLKGFGRDGYAIVKQEIKRENQVEGNVEPSPMQILSMLAEAFKDQAKAFSDQAAIMKSIESKMAQDRTQATIATNLNSLREDIRAISARQKGTGEVVLKVLERLDKKKKGELLTEADMRILQIDKELHESDNADVARK